MMVAVRFVALVFCPRFVMQTVSVVASLFVTECTVGTMAVEECAPVGEMVFVWWDSVCVSFSVRARTVATMAVRVFVGSVLVRMRVKMEFVCVFWSVPIKFVVTMVARVAAVLVKGLRSSVSMVHASVSWSVMVSSVVTMAAIVFVVFASVRTYVLVVVVLVFQVVIIRVVEIMVVAVFVVFVKVHRSSVLMVYVFVS